ncbi:MAG: 4-hydroxybenzoate octaprenyltransferase [Sutterellaceae bacterium]|nr:4-hydroxybenzoate octaprenyltransferase [Burkholderiaceae bacterium]MDW8429456.1 4-hydroxybenzoate octaprenyltransferase [Sutterellaceae bacterium]
MKPIVPTGPSCNQKLNLYAQLARFDKPVGTFLLLWPTLAALWIAADGAPAPLLVAIFSLGTLLMRSAGCAINDVLDRNFDGHVKRTADRVIPTGRVRPLEGVAVAVVLAAAAGLLILPLNATTFYYALVALAVAVSYPLFKRFFPLPQAWLGIAFSFGIPMAFAAVQGQVPALGWLMFVGNLCWVIAYDTEYAMVDRDDDLKVGIRSAAIFFGGRDVAAVMLLYGVHLAVLVGVGRAVGAGWPFYAGLLAAALIALYHYTLIRNRSREGCFRAFRHNQWLGFAVFAGVVTDYALR